MHTGTGVVYVLVRETLNALEFIFSLDRLGNDACIPGSISIEPNLE